MRQLDVVVECGFILPAGVDVELSRISDGAERVDGKASGFFPGWAQDLLDGGGDGVLQSFFGMEAGEDEEFGCHYVRG